VEGLVSTKVSVQVGLLDKEWSSHRRYHYKNNQKSQGIDLIFKDKATGNCRTIATSMLEELWELARHNHFNLLCGEVIVEFGPRSTRIKTLNNKTQIDFQDPNWEKIVAAINKLCPPQSLPRSRFGSDQSESALKDELEIQLKAHYESRGFNVHREIPIFPLQLVKADFAIDKDGSEWRVWECKPESAGPQAAYQLMMYWDGVVETNGVSPQIGTLVCRHANENTRRMVEYLNSRVDKLGNPYNFIIQTWQELGIIRD